MNSRFRPSPPVSSPAIETMVSHFSVRHYDDAPVPESHLDSILTAALSAPTSSNQNLWSAIVVQDPQRKSELQELTGNNPFITEAPVFIVFVADASRLSRLAKDQGAAAEALHYQESLITVTVDAALAAQNAVVAAESLGYGTCYVGGIRENMQSVCDLLNLPEYAYPVVGLSIGRPAKSNQNHIRPRLPLQSVLFLETYDPKQSDAGINQLEQDNLEYFQTQGIQGASWKKRALRRIGSAASIGNRATNRLVLEARGFLAK